MNPTSSIIFNRLPTMPNRLRALSQKLHTPLVRRVVRLRRMQAWPFLICGNKHLENRPVVLPDFVKGAGAEREIIRAAGGFETTEGEAIYFKGFHEGLGDVDMVFRVRHATEKMLGEASDAVLTDKQGRPLRMIEGFVLRKRNLNGPFTAPQLDRAHELVEPHFREFWDKQHWQDAASTAFELPEPRQEPLRLKQMESPTVPKALPSAARSSTTTEELVEKATHTKMNHGVVFSVVAGVALGVVYLAHRQFSKTKSQPQDFVSRLSDNRSQQQPKPNRS